jgi:predicted nuclease of predicted toxin-antitoxin system
LNFKIDENLPAEFEPVLRNSGFEADTVGEEGLSGSKDSVVLEQCHTEDRVPLTLDLDFANVQAYPPKSHSGIIVFRTQPQDKRTVIALLKRLVPVLKRQSPRQQLWIVEYDRIRYRED